MKRKITIKKKTVVQTLKPKQLQNVTGGKGGGGPTCWPQPDSCVSRYCTGW